MSNRNVETNVHLDETNMTLFCGIVKNASLRYIDHALVAEKHRLAFEAGQFHAIVELQQWVIGKLQERKPICLVEILGYLQAKLDLLAGQPQQVANGSSFAPPPPDEGCSSEPRQLS